MLWTRSELKGRAKFLLKQNYWYSVLAALIYTFLLGNGFTYSYNVLKNKNSEVETSIQGFHPILMFGIAATVAVVVVISFIVYLAIVYFLWNPMTVGCCKFFKNGRDGRQDVKDIFRRRDGSTFISFDWRRTAWILIQGSEYDGFHAWIQK